MVAFNPASVEPKFRLLAYLVTATLAIGFGCALAYAIYNAAGATHVVTSRTDYGSLPNIWLCTWTNGTNANATTIIEPDSIQVKETGTFNLIRSDILFDQRPWPFASHGGPAANGLCAFFQLSSMRDPLTHLFVKIRSHLVSSTTEPWRDCAVYADSPANSSHGGQYIQPSQSVLGWMGAVGRMPLLYTTMTKHVVGTEYFMSVEKHAEYYGTVLGTYADETPDKTREQKNEVEVWLDIPIEFSGVPGVAESLQQSIGPRVFKAASTFGGYFSIMGAVFAVFFVQKHARSFKLTLRTPAYHRRAKDVYNLISDDEDEVGDAQGWWPWSRESSEEEPVYMYEVNNWQNNGAYGDSHTRSMRMERNGKGFDMGYDQGGYGKGYGQYGKGKGQF